MADFSLAGQVALVTGGSRGLGRHFAEVLAKAGAEVVLFARDQKALDQAAAEIAKAAGKRTLAIAGDVTESASLAAAFGRAEQGLGGVSILINNAGIAVAKPVLEHSAEDWDRVLDTNLKGAFLASQEFARRRIMAKSGGRIVNIASLLAFRTAKQIPSYVAAKAGLAHLTRDLAMEWARYGITVNALAPGYFETDLNRGFLNSDAGRAVTARIPFGRTGKLPELDGALLLLTSPAGSYISGAVIPVDGGHDVASV